MRLLHTLFSQAQIAFIEGDESGWLTKFVYTWLGTFHPEVFSPMGRDWPREQKRMGHLSYESYLNDLALGAEDVAAESLDWQPIAPGGEPLAYLTSAVSVGRNDSGSAPVAS